MKMNIRALYVIWLREIKMFLRFKSRIVGLITLVFLAMMILRLGLGFGRDVKVGELSYVDYLVSGLICFMLILPSFLSGLGIIADRRFGFLRELLIAPISNNTIILGKILGNTTISILRVAVMLGAFISIGIIEMPDIKLLFLCIMSMALIAASFASLGVAFASFMSDMEGFTTLFYVFILPIFSLSGGFYPVDKIHPLLKVITCCNPLTYGFDIIKYCLIRVSTFNICLDLTILVSFTILTVVGGRILFYRSLI